MGSFSFWKWQQSRARMPHTQFGMTCTLQGWKLMVPHAARRGSVLRGSLGCTGSQQPPHLSLSTIVQINPTFWFPFLQPVLETCRHCSALEQGSKRRTGMGEEPLGPHSG